MINYAAANSKVNMNWKSSIHYGVIPVTEFNSEIFYEELIPEYNCKGCEFEGTEDNYNCDVCENFVNKIQEDGLLMILDEYNDVWVFESPVKTRCSYCSPCAPNAGYITSQNEDGIETYMPPAEWLNNPEKFKIEKV